MICRMWRAWATQANADVYDHYLNHELFPKVLAELRPRGYRGYQVLRLTHAEEVEFVTMVWFDSLDAVRAFAGESYETPVITEKAQGLLSRWQEWCEHFEVSALQPPG